MKTLIDYVSNKDFSTIRKLLIDIMYKIDYDNLNEKKRKLQNFSSQNIDLQLMIPKLMS